jgi:hypothetical protein
MYVPLMSEITLEKFIFDYSKQFKGSINAFIYKGNGGNDPIKEEMLIITMGHFTIPPQVIPAFLFHIYFQSE